MGKQFITIDGSRMAYIEEGHGFPVVLGHSFLWDAEMWRPQINELSRHFRVLVPELWGHGDSEAPPECVSDLSSITRQHLAFLDALGVDRCHLVGLSVGGMWGAQLAIEKPERIDRLVLMDTYLGAEPPDTRDYYFKLLDTVAEAGQITEDMRNTIVPMFFHPTQPTVPEIREQFHQALSSMNCATIRDSLHPMGKLIFGRPDLLEQLSQLPADRTIILVGDQDRPRPPAEANEMARRINCLAAQIPVSGHISNLENPQVVTDLLLNWLPRHH